MSTHLNHLLEPLSPRLRAVVDQLWSIGHYQDATLAALRELEIEVRRRVGSPDLVGEALMAAAFNDKAGGIGRLSAHPGEASAAFFMYAGVMRFVRNPLAHRRVDLDPVDAAQLLGYVDLLFKWLDGGLERKVDGPGIRLRDDGPILADIDGDGRRELVRLVTEELGGPGVRPGRRGARSPEDTTTRAWLVLERGSSELARMHLGDDERTWPVWEVFAQDLDNDARAEILVLTVQGAHSQNFDLFGFRDGHLIPLTETLFADGGFFFKDVDGDGQREVISGHRRYQLGEPGVETIDDDTRYELYDWVDGHLVRVPGDFAFDPWR